MRTCCISAIYVDYQQVIHGASSSLRLSFHIAQRFVGWSLAYRHRLPPPVDLFM